MKYKKFKIKTKRRAVPHVTIIAPFHTRNQRRLVKDFKKACSNQKEIPKFKIDGYGCFYNSKVIFIKIKPGYLYLHLYFQY